MFGVLLRLMLLVMLLIEMVKEVVFVSLVVSSVVTFCFQVRVARSARKTTRVAARQQFWAILVSRALRISVTQHSPKIAPYWGRLQ